MKNQDNMQLKQTIAHFKNFEDFMNGLKRQNSR